MASQKVIEKILEEKNFSEIEKKSFKKVFEIAKMLQTLGDLEKLDSRIEVQVIEVAKESKIIEK